MNNQMPYGFMPSMPQQGQGPVNQSCNCSNELGRVGERLENLERQIRRLERRVNNLENAHNNAFIKPMPISNISNDDNQFSNNYMI